MPLSSAQLSSYRSDGFAVGGRLLDDGELSKLRGGIDALISGLHERQRPENMPSVHYQNKYFRDLFLSDKLVDVAEQVLGPDIALFTTYIISKRPGDGLAVDWHQDAAFFPIKPMETFTLWLAVDDSDDQNGCLRVIPGSHRSRSVLSHAVDTVSGTTLPLSMDKIDTSEAFDIELRAGEYSVHDPYILHGSRPNTSSRRRCGITIKYIPTYVKIDRTFRSPTGFDWKNIRVYLARGRSHNNTYDN